MPFTDEEFRIVQLHPVDGARMLLATPGVQSAAWAADDQPFTVHRESTGETFVVPADRTILETLRAAGESLPSSCESGTCGTCRTRLVEGPVDHRDMVLIGEERDRNIMICVSRALGDDLVLDW